MEVTFATKKLEKLLGTQPGRVKKYGPENARKIAKRLDQLKAAPCLQDVQEDAGTHPLYNDLKGHYGVHVKEPFRLIIQPNPPEKNNPSEITKIIVTGIIDYH